MRATRTFTTFLILASATAPLFANWTKEREAYVEAFHSRDAEGRIAAVEALREFDNRDGAKLLLWHFETEKNERVIAALARKICELGDPDAREFLRNTVLGEKDAKRRSGYCRLFAEGHGLDRIDILKKFFEDRDPGVRSAAAATVNAPDALLTHFVATLVTDPVPEVRKQGIQALGRIATFEAVEPLIVCVENEKAKDVRTAAMEALHRITDRNYGANTEAWRGWWRRHQVQDMTAAGQAIARGGEYLRVQLKAALAFKPDPKKPLDMSVVRTIPVMMYALVHAGIPASDPDFKAGLAWIATEPPDGTYNCSLMALALADFDPAKYRGRLAELAQILSDQQSTNGQWSYGYASRNARSESGSGAPPPDVESGAGDGTVRSKVKIKIDWRDGSRATAGDNSNTQFAILGLRATTEAGCEIPKQVWERSLDWFIKAQEQPYGGWGYRSNKSEWAMTCCGLTSVTICMRALGQDEAFRGGRPLEVERIKNGVDWLDEHWMNMKQRPGNVSSGGWGVYYDLYSVERVGMIVGLDRIRAHDWYGEGSEQLFALQATDGSWGGNPIDTAFAILFLKRATRGYEVSPQDD